MSQCPVCKGRGGSPGISCSQDWCIPDTIKCPFCGGTGEITDQQQDWYDVGRYMMRCRRERGRTLREEAKARGMTASFLAAMEHGRIQPVAAYGDGGPIVEAGNLPESPDSSGGRP